MKIPSHILVPKGGNSLTKKRCASRSRTNKCDTRTRPHRLASGVEAIDAWRRRPVFRARIVNSEVEGIVVKSVRSFRVGKRIFFARLSELRGLDTDRAPASDKWRSAVIWRIDRDCLHLTRT